MCYNSINDREIRVISRYLISRDGYKTLITAILDFCNHLLIIKTKAMIYNNLINNGSFGIFFLSLVVGIIFIYHGLPKIKEAKKMAGAMGWPVEIIMLLGLVEVLGGALMIIGIYAKLAALVFAIIMVGAIVMKISKWKAPFSAHDKTGWEFDLILLAANITIFYGVVVYMGMR